jgi:hypothetical protein
MCFENLRLAKNTHNEDKYLYKKKEEKRGELIIT